MKKITMFAMLLFAATTFPACAGEFVHTDEGIRYDNGDESWFEETMIAGWIMSVEGMIYRLEESGEAIAQPRNCSGWMKDDTGWYYRLSDGSFVTNAWKQIGDIRYYFDQKGYMVTGPVFDDSGTGRMDWPYELPFSLPSEEEKTERYQQTAGMADEVLEDIISEGMTDRKKAEAIWHWIRDNLRVSGMSKPGDIIAAANDGFRKRHGDCYTYFATATMLLYRAGIPNIGVIRSTDNNHYWNLVKVEEGWYHFDSYPTKIGGNVLLFTDEQVAPSSSHVFDHRKYPPTPQK